MNKHCLFISMSLITLFGAQATLAAADGAHTYPTTRKGETVDQYFDTKVADPYRWLEDDRSAETEDWVKRQNAVTFSYLDQIPYRTQIKDRLLELWNYEKISSPFKEGGYTYFYKNDGLQDQSVVYRQKENQQPEVFLDPNSFSADGTTSLAQLSFSKDGSLAAYSISEGGSDWRKIIVIDAQTKKQLGDPIVDVKFSGISWHGNKGFYYSSYDKPEGSELSAKTDQHTLYFHTLGEAQSEDAVVFGGTEDQKRRYVGGYVTEDDRFLVITAANSTSGNELYIKDLTKPDGDLLTLLDNMNSDTFVIDNQGDTVLLQTNLNAPNQRVVSLNINKPTQKNWVEVIPETKNVLSASTGGGYLFAEYMVDAISKVYQYDYSGNKVREVNLPGPGSATAISGKRNENELYYSFSNSITPSTIFRFDTRKGKSVVYQKSGAQFDSANYETKQVFYKSKDGTKVPMTISYRKGTKLDGTAPTILFGYGGFNISLTPSFRITRALWMEMGGIYAVANLRGGGEYGKAWHDAGRLQNKQNVFDDFIAAAQYLTANKYTSKQRLAISGGSNGGLLVGAAMTQRPELFQVALPAVGVLDMLRYHTFTAGAGWAYDYGTSEQSKEMFEYLAGYSPLHNIKNGTAYPATLVTTADHDDRVVPAHSFKFISELQSKHAGDTPTMIRIETNAGHGAGMALSQRVAITADVYSFTLHNMGIKQLSITTDR